jgi:hypothetical protein
MVISPYVSPDANLLGVDRTVEADRKREHLYEGSASGEVNLLAHHPAFSLSFLIIFAFVILYNFVSSSHYRLLDKPLSNIPTSHHGKRLVAVEHKHASLSTCPPGSGHFILSSYGSICTRHVLSWRCRPHKG